MLEKIYIRNRYEKYLIFLHVIPRKYIKFFLNKYKRISKKIYIFQEILKCIENAFLGETKEGKKDTLLQNKKYVNKIKFSKKKIYIKWNSQKKIYKTKFKKNL